MSSWPQADNPVAHSALVSFLSRAQLSRIGHVCGVVIPEQAARDVHRRLRRVYLRW